MTHYQPSDRKVECARCGFMCDLNRDVTSRPGSKSGWGKTIAATATYDDSSVTYDKGTLGYDGHDYDAVTITRGCPFCGTLLYNMETGR